MLERFWKNGACSPPLAKIFSLCHLPIPLSFENLCSSTQKHFLRPKGKERFQLHDPFSHWIRKKAFHREFKALGLTEPILPKYSEYSSIILLGTSYLDMCARIQFFLSLNLKWKELFCLTGKRPLAKSERRFLSPFLPPFEDFMIDELAKNLLPPSFSYSLIISKMDGTNRPTTKDTLIDWLKKNPPKEPTLLISNQPYGEYQLLVASSVSSIPFDIGAAPPCEKKDSIAIYLDTIARILYLLNS